MVPGSYIFMPESRYLNVTEATPELSMDDLEVQKQVVVNAVQTSWDDKLLSQILKATADWNKLNRIIAFVIKFVQHLKNKVDCGTVSNNVFSEKLLNEADAKILQMVKQHHLVEKLIF